MGRPERSSATPPVVALRGARVAIADRVLFEDADVSVSRGDRICLVGRNGSGKSTLLKALSGEIDIDDGDRFVQPGARIAYLPQDPRLPRGITVREHVADAIPPAERDVPTEHVVDAVLIHLRLDGERLMDGLSGGESRRVAIARALVGKPDILLLDEPTNHLDLPTIEWLENELRRFAGGLLMISHDRRFLSALSNRTLWLDRGQIRRQSRGFDGFQEWAEKLQADEEVERKKLDRKIAEETRWLREGLTARRKRNEGRVRALTGLRRDKADWLRRPGEVRFSLSDAERGGQLVVEANHLSKTFTNPDGSEKIIAQEFSTLVRRGDRIGLIGPNGAGKTTLLKMLIEAEKPDKGRVRVGFGVEAVYFDQYREQLDPETSLWATLAPDGADTVEVGGKPKHVVSYLRDFLFEDRQAQAKVKSLSGGERNRLLLARLFAKPHNLIVLDEPTNDLDIETLDLLQDVLAEYDGTIILVSHDRDFLDRTVTSIIAVEGDGDIMEYAGGFTDYLSQRPTAAGEDAASDANKSRPEKKSSEKAASPARAAVKLGYKEQRELDSLPTRMSELSEEISGLETEIADPDLYHKKPKRFASATTRLEAARSELEAAEERWLELEERREDLERARTA